MNARRRGGPPSYDDGRFVPIAKLFVAIESADVLIDLRPESVVQRSVGVGAWASSRSRLSAGGSLVHVRLSTKP